MRKKVVIAETPGKCWKIMKDSGDKREETPSGYNNLPTFPEEVKEVPCVYLQAMYEEESFICKTKLDMIAMTMSSSIDSEFVLVPYFNCKDSDSKYPNLPLWVINRLLAGLCLALGYKWDKEDGLDLSDSDPFTCEIQGMMCLNAQRDSGYDLAKPIPVDQYYSTIPNDLVIMTDYSLFTRPIFQDDQKNEAQKKLHQDIKDLLDDYSMRKFLMPIPLEYL